MLQIILFILKIIGWILLVILGLVVLVLLAALFTPLRYQAEASCKGKLSTLEAGVKFGIFFRLVSGAVQYQDGELSWNVRAAWLKFGNVSEEEDAETAGEYSEEKKGQTVSAAGDEDDGGEPGISGEKQEPDISEEAPGISGEKKESDISEEAPAISAEKRETEAFDVKESKSRKKGSEVSEKVETDSTAEKPDFTKEEDPDKNEQKEEQGTGQSSAGKIVSLFEKIKYTFHRICDKIKMLLKKAERVKAFLTNEVHQSAFLKCLAELKKMLYKLRPKHIGGEIRFGFEDPSLTGKMLAGASMLYPYLDEKVCFYPDFEQKLLEGELSVKGSLRMLPAAVFLWNMLWNRNVRRTIRDAKRFIARF